MARKTAALLTVLAAVLLCLARPASAETLSAMPVKPGALRALLATAGIGSEMLQPDDATRSIHIPDLKGSDVIIGLPAAGILQGKTFSLEIDGMTALVRYTQDAGLGVVAGDSRIESVEAFGTVSCILTSVFEMVLNIVKNALTVNVLGILTAVFNGVLNIIGCAGA